MRSSGTRTIGLALGGLLVCAAWATTDPWNARTTLTFSSPVRVPGATLQAGSYEFSLVNPASGRHVVQIATDNGSRVVAVTQAVPTKRVEASAGVMLTFSATEPGAAPALKAWFYPGSVDQRHEFVYPEDEARAIAASPQDRRAVHRRSWHRRQQGHVATLRRGRQR